MAAKKKPILVSAVKTREFAEILVARLVTAQVKTASPSRAQTKIQARVTWLEPDGKHGLGYVAISTSDAELLVKGRDSGPGFKNFVDDVFRTTEWAKEMSHKSYQSDHNWGAYHTDLHNELQKLGFFNADSSIHDLYKQAVDAIRKCAAAGKHKTARVERDRKRAERYLDQAITFAVQNGLKDAEIQEIIHVAFVKHTMES